MSFGLTSAGFVRKTLEQIKSEIEDEYKTAFGNSVDLDPRRPVGQMIGISSEREAFLWELAEAIYNAYYPDTADDASLDDVVALTGIRRNAATYSTAVVTLTGTVATVVPEGFQVSVSGNSDLVFATTEEVTIGGGGTVDVTVRATETGAKAALAGTLTVIVSSLFGVDSATNATDATVGFDRETPAELRLRRLETLARPGSSTAAAIRSDLLDIDAVEAVTVFENLSILEDADGRPPKCFEALVKGGTDENIAASIWSNKPAGMQSFGSEEIEITDSQGFTKNVYFSRPTVVDIYLELDLTVSSAFPVDGSDLVKAQVLLYGATLNLGDDVIVIPALISYLNGVPGILNAVVRIGKTVSPTLDENVSIDLDEIAEFDTSRITVATS